MNVVGVNEKSGLLGENVQKVPEGFGFILVCHDPRMCLGSVNRNAETAARIGVGSALAAADERSARGQNSGFDAMSATRAKFHDGSTSRSRGNARGLAGDQSLEVKDTEEAGF